MEFIKENFPDLYSSCTRNSANRIFRCFVAMGLVTCSISIHKEGAYRWIGVQGMIDKIEPLILEEQAKKQEESLYDIKDEFS